MWNKRIMTYLQLGLFLITLIDQARNLTLKSDRSIGAFLRDVLSLSR